MLLQMPYFLQRRGNDYVSYTAIDQNGGKADVDNICYHKHMSLLTTHEFICVPYRTNPAWRDHFIDGGTYLRFIETLKKHQLITEATEAWVDDQGVPMMRLPRGTSRHRAYSALCAYRWAESLSPLVWAVMKLYDDEPDITIWQILHYVMAVHVSGIGHNWCNVGITDPKTGYVYMNNGQSFNMGYSLAFPLFWYKTEEELLVTQGRTCEAIQKVAEQIAPVKQLKAIHMPAPTLLVNGAVDQCDICNPRWLPLYKLAATAAVGNWPVQQTKEQLLAMYEEIAQAHPDLQALREKVETPKKNGYQYVW